MRFPRGGIRPLLAILLAVGLVVTATPSNAGQPFPPQLPSAAQMRALQKKLESTLSKVRGATARLDSVVAELERGHAELGRITLSILEAQTKQDALDAELRGALALLNDRAIAAYKTEPVGLISVILKAKNFNEFVSAFTFVKSVSRQDFESLLSVRELRGAALQARTDLEANRQAQQALLSQLATQRDAVEDSLRAVQTEFKKVQKEIDRAKSGFSFPVRAPYSYTNTFGAPRYENGRYHHAHQGTDIFALKGTPVVAVVDGELYSVGTSGRAGVKLWLRSPGDRWTYFYAHLSSFASGVRSGLRVRKGQVIGYVGNTGNARTTPAHLHFETHASSGAAVNPYPILRRVDLTR